MVREIELVENLPVHKCDMQIELLDSSSLIDSQKHRSLSIPRADRAQTATLHDAVDFLPPLVCFFVFPHTSP